MRRNVLFIADTMSQLKPAQRIAESFAEHRGFSVIGNVLPGKSSPTREQVAETAPQCPLTFTPLERLFTRGDVLEFDVVVAFLPGSKLFEVLLRMNELIALRKPRRRPILVTGYNGVVYEKHVEGLLWRVGYDLIAINSKCDEETFSTHLQGLGVDRAPLTRTGIILAQSDRAEPVAAYGSRASRDILFATQAVVPRRLSERTYLLGRLRELAEAHPDRRIIVKPRTRVTERTFHVEKHHYAVLADRMFGSYLPPNLLFGYGSLASFLPRIGLVATVSSTAVMEGIAHGVPGAILTDLGIKETLGNHFFSTSGMLASFDDLVADRVPPPCPDWLRDNGFAEDDGIGRLVDRTVELLEKQDRLDVALPMPRPYYGPTTARHIYETRLPLRNAWSGANGNGARRNGHALGPWPGMSPAEVVRKLGKLRRSPRRFFIDALLNRIELED